MHNATPDPALSTLGEAVFLVPVRWGDMDALNHVNNVAYFRYLEEARVQCMQRILAGASAEDRAAVPAKRNFVLAHASCDFLQPLFYPAEARVALGLTRLGSASMALSVRIARSDAPDQPVAQGSNVLVGIDGDTGRPLPWTDAERRLILQCFQAENSV